MQHRLPDIGDLRSALAEDGRTCCVAGDLLNFFLLQILADLLQPQIKAAIFLRMHFSRHISLSHSTSTLLAALKLRSRAH